MKKVGTNMLEVFAYTKIIDCNKLSVSINNLNTYFPITQNG